jgi:hypothetical protein
MEQGEETAYKVTIKSANGKIDKTINSRLQRTNQVYYQIKNSREEENKNNLKMITYKTACLPALHCVS